jgi:photosystem II stability/assembly factor-like uncharacterized protein
MKHLILIIAILISTGIANAQWIKIDSVPTNNSLWNIKFPSKNIGFAVGALGTIVKTTDGGDTWKLIYNNKSSQLESLFCLDTNKVYIVGNGIYKSNDGGQTWISKSIGTNNNLHSIFFVDSIVGYAVGESGLILKTIDQGISWQTLKMSNSYNNNSVYFIDRDTGFVAGNDGIFKTTNGGNTWILSKAALDTRFRSLYFTDKNVGYVSGEMGVILKTINCGIDWFPVNNSLKYDLNSIIFPTSEIGYAFGVAGIILKTINAGQRWSMYYGNGYSDLYAASFISADTGFVVGREGVILKTINGGGPEYNYNPLKDFTSQVSYWNCDYAMVYSSFNVDTIFAGDTACWDFGDQRSYCISNSNGASHVYSKPGIYTISLTFTHNGNSKTITKQNIVTIRNKPTPSFEYYSKDTLLYAPSTINFINKTIPGDGDTLMYFWDFGDGATSDSSNVTHTYNNAGTYHVSLNVSDNLGCKFNASDELIIKDTLQRNEFSFITSNCLNENEEPRCGYNKHFTIENDTLKIYGFYSGNCCTDKTATLRNIGDTIYIRTFETGPECTCGCGYCFSINVPNIRTDSIIVSFDGNITVAKIQTSVSDLKNACYLEIYPNPASNEFTILSNYLNSASSIEMTDLSGVRRYYEPNTSSDRMVINCSDFTPGVYILKVNSNNGSFISKKVIIKSNH